MIFAIHLTIIKVLSSSFFYSSGSSYVGLSWSYIHTFIDGGRNVLRVHIHEGKKPSVNTINQ
jgi:hypothetical protein